MQHRTTLRTYVFCIGLLCLAGVMEVLAKDRDPAQISAHCVKATADSNQETALLQLEKTWLAAEDDPDALDAILADDFIHVLPVGFVTKKEQLSYMRSHPSPKHETKHFEELRVRIFGSAGVVNGIVVATGADGKTRRTIFTDLFACQGGRWQAVNAQELPLGK